MTIKSEYDAEYYEANSQGTDRLANYFFSDILKRYLMTGTLLEYGCGSGFFIQKFNNEKYVKFAFDISDHAMEQTKQNNPKIKLINDPSKEIKPESLDGVAALHVLEHIAKPELTVLDFHRMLKKNGILFFTVPNMSSVGRKLKKGEWFGYRDKTHISLLAPIEWRRIVIDSGFEILKVGSDGLWDVPYIKSMPTFIQKIIFYPTSAVQVLAKKTFLPIWSGENLVVIARKK